MSKELPPSQEVIEPQPEPVVDKMLEARRQELIDIVKDPNNPEYERYPYLRYFHLKHLGAPDADEWGGGSLAPKEKD